MMQIELPSRPFFYTFDQLETLLNMPQKVLLTHVHLGGYSPGRQTPDLMLATDNSPQNSSRPDWRVEEAELVRWLRRRGYTVTRGQVVIGKPQARRKRFPQEPLAYADQTELQ